MRKWLPLVAVSLGTFMLLIDVTIVNVALPDMASGLSTSFTSLQWVIDIYALLLAALVLGAGSVADLFGQRRTYGWGLALFAAASFVCGTAPNVTTLITARAVQGVGAAAMFATVIALLNSSYTGRDRGTAYGMWGAVSGAAAAVGPVLGGLLTEFISWRWIFFVNLPISILAIVMCIKVIRPDTDLIKTKIDYAGIGSFTAAAGLVTYGLIQANEHGWGSGVSIGTLIAGIVLLAVFVVVENRSDHPTFDMRLLHNRSFVGVLVCGLLLNFSAFAYFTYTSIWLQSVLGLSPIQAGLTGLPMSIAAFAVSAGIGRFLHSRNPAPIIGGGLLLVGLGGLLCAVLMRGSASWPALLPGFFITGIGVGLALPTVNSAGMAAAPPQRGGMAGGSVNTMRQLGFAFGIAILGSAFAARAQHVLDGRGADGASGLAHSLAGGQAPGVLARTPPAARAQLDELFHAASISGLRAAFLVAAVAGIAGSALAFALIRPSAAKPAGRGEPSGGQAKVGEPSSHAV